jgi:Family of unknown function (DUF6401)
MTSEYGTAADAMTVGAARASLDHLMAWVGVDGLVAAMRSPGLLARVDQHSAAVRDALGEAGLDAPTLAEYARVVHAAALRRGESMPDPARLDWLRAPAYLIRLVAVCSLAEAAGAL